MQRLLRACPTNTIDRSTMRIVLPITITSNKAIFSEDVMLELVLAVCSMLGGEASTDWAARIQQAQHDKALNDWWTWHDEVRRGVRPGNMYFAPAFQNPAMQWAVPNSVLSGPAAAAFPPSPYPPAVPFPATSRP